MSGTIVALSAWDKRIAKQTSLSLAIVARLRRAWPLARIIVRGDSGFCRQRLIRWCERRGVGQG
jgi:hypothetical protein